MPGSGNPQYIDGFSSVQAVRHSSQRKGQGPRKPESEPPSSGPEEKPRHGQPGTRIGHTVRPPSYQIECFGCGYTFKLTGRLSKTYCPKCRKALEVDDYTIEPQEEWNRDITTIGSIEVKPGAAIHDARILAREMSLAGRLSNLSGYIFGFLELRKGASFELGELRVNDIRIAADGKFNLRHKLECRDLTVMGEVKGNLHVHGTLTIRRGGCVRGDVRAPRLVVEDGGGLHARVRIIDPARENKEKNIQGGNT